jgi:hypothetical protein
MITARSLRAPLHLTVAGLSVLDIAVALILSAALAAGIVGALPFGTDHGSVAAAAGALLMTLPLAWRHRAPLATAAVLAGGALLNGLIFGPMVRCGAALPAVYMVAFTIGTIRDRARSATGLALCAAAVVAEGLYDPRIETQGLPFVLVLLVAFFAAGCLVGARTRTAEALRQRSAELRDQREHTARLAVLADRAKMSADLEGALHARIGGIAATAAAGLGALAGEDDGPAAATGDADAAARQALASIEHDGRAVLGHLREVLGSLRERAPSEPQPTLASMSGLLARATTADARLTVEGNPRTLPAGLELSGYRIVEHLLQALADTPGAAVDVRLHFRPDALELHVSGPPAPSADTRAVLAAARERARLHGGTVHSRQAGGVCYATARLPLVSSHA